MDKSYKCAELRGAEAAFAFDLELASVHLLFVSLRQANVSIFLSSQPTTYSNLDKDNFLCPDWVFEFSSLILFSIVF